MHFHMRAPGKRIKYEYFTQGNDFILIECRFILLIF
jgi:hypothetical protein